MLLLFHHILEAVLTSAQPTTCTNISPETTTSFFMDPNSLVATRAKRANAGSRLKELIEIEGQATGARQTFLTEDDENVELLFQEDENDEEFEEPQQSQSEDDKDEGEEGEEQTEEQRETVEDENDSDTARAVNSDEMLSDSDLSASDNDESEGERELEKSERAKKRKRLKTIIPTIKKVKVAPAVKAVPKPGLISSESLLYSQRRASSRTSAVENKQALVQRLQEDETRRAALTPVIRVKEKELTQEERLAQAVETEKENVISLQMFLEQEIVKKERQKWMFQQKRAKLRNVVRLISKETYVTPLDEIEDARRFQDLFEKKRRGRKRKNAADEPEIRRPGDIDTTLPYYRREMEERRILEERMAEERRILEEKRAEERRILEAARAEKKKKLEQQRAERKKRLEEQRLARKKAKEERMKGYVEADGTPKVNADGTLVEQPDDEEDHMEEEMKDDEEFEDEEAKDGEEVEVDEGEAKEETVRVKEECLEIDDVKEETKTEDDLDDQEKSDVEENRTEEENPETQPTSPEEPEAVDGIPEETPIVEEEEEEDVEMKEASEEVEVPEDADTSVVKEENDTNEEGKDGDEVKDVEETKDGEETQDGEEAKEAQDSSEAKIEKKVTFSGDLDTKVEESEPAPAEPESSTPTPMYRPRADGLVFEGPVQLVSRNMITLLEFDDEDRYGRLPETTIKMAVFGEDGALGGSRRFREVKTILRSSLRADNPYATPKEEREDELLQPVTEITEDSPMFEELKKLRRLGIRDEFELEEEDNTMEEDNEVHIRTEAPNGLYLPNGNRKMCLISGKEVRYFDPATGVPYETVDVFKVIKSVEQGTVPWYSITKDQNTYGAVEIYLNSREGNRHAKGVPEGFDGW